MLTGKINCNLPLKFIDVSISLLKQAYIIETGFLSRKEAQENRQAQAVIFIRDSVGRIDSILL